MAGTFPTAGFTAMELQTNTRSRLTESVSGQTQRIKSGAQYWSFKLKSPPLSRSDFNAIYSFIIQQDGQVESFTVVPPVIASTTGTAAGTVTVADVNTADPLLSTSAGSSSVGVSGGTGTLKKGDLIKFSNHNKVYMLTGGCGSRRFHSGSSQFLSTSRGISDRRCHNHNLQFSAIHSIFQHRSDQL